MRAYTIEISKLKADGEVLVRVWAGDVEMQNRSADNRGPHSMAFTLTPELASKLAAALSEAGHAAEYVREVRLGS